MGGGRGPGDVAPVRCRHPGQLVQRPDLLGEFLAVADDVRAGGPGVQQGALGTLGRHEPVGAVERDAPVVADDAAAAVGVRQSGDDARLAGGAHGGGVGVEHAVVVGLAVGAEDLGDEGVGFVAVRLQAVLHHAHAAVGHDRPLERGVGLQADDQFAVPVDVPGGVRGDRGGRRGVHVEDAPAALLGEQRADLLPHLAGAVRGSGQEGCVAFVGRVVGLDEVAHVDAPTPSLSGEVPPGVGGPGACSSPSRSSRILSSVFLPCRYSSRARKAGSAGQGTGLPLWSR